MLSINWVQSPDYYLDQANPDYYFQGGEPEGTWWGRGAQERGLLGTVTREELTHLFRGEWLDGTRLVKNAGHARRQAAWDLTFSAPKDFSILWSEADRELRAKLEEVMRKAEEMALDYLADVAAWTRLGKGGTELQRAGLMVAKFPHGTSRESDPNRHTHCVVVNVATREDKKTGAILSKPLYDHKMAAGAIFQAALAYWLLEDLRIATCQAKVGFTIPGISEALRKEQSKRREQIRDELKAKGHESAKAAAIATLSTRKAKRANAPPREKLFAKWQETNHRHGFDAKAIAALHKSGRKVRQSKSEVRKELVKVVHAAKREIAETSNAFTERDLVRVACRHCIPRGLSPALVIPAVRNFLAKSESVVPLGREKGYLRYALRETIEIERQLLLRAERLMKKKNLVSAPALVEHYLNKYLPTDEHAANTISQSDFIRNEQQRKGVEHITLREGNIQFVSGLAGTGKTYMLKVAREIWEAQGFRVVGVSLAGVAARRLEEQSGIPSETLALRLKQLRGDRRYAMKYHLKQLRRASKRKRTYKLKRFKLDKKTIVVLDEAAMVGTKQFEELLEHIEKAGAKLAGVGDRKQIQPIEAGGPTQSLELRLGKGELTHITRQALDEADENPEWQRDVVHYFRQGRSVDALLELARRNRLQVLDDRDRAIEKMTGDWLNRSLREPEKHVLLAAKNDEIRILNAACQNARRKAGLLGNWSVRVSREETTEEEIHASDRVVFHQKSRQLGIENGDAGTVTNVDPLERKLTVKLDSGRQVTIRLKNYNHVSLGYAMTVHKAQGGTFDRASALVGGHMQDLHSTYVQVSRHKWVCVLYTDRFEAGKQVQNLAVQMATAREKGLAIDHLETQPTKKLPKRRDLKAEKVKHDTEHYFQAPERTPRHAHFDDNKLRELAKRVGVESPPKKIPKKLDRLLKKLRETAQPVFVAPSEDSHAVSKETSAPKRPIDKKKDIEVETRTHALKLKKALE